MKTFLKLITAVIFAAFSGGMFAAVVGLPAVPVIGVLGVASVIPGIAPEGSVLAGVYTEVWTKQVIKQFEQGLKDTFLDGVLDYSQYVTGDSESQVIHSTYFGVEPDVLINNSTYPIAIQELNGEDIPISLDKYQTKATPITDDELGALSYDKMGLVKIAHGDAIVRNRLKKAIHAFGPASHSTDHPVLLTTGAADMTGRKRLIWNDVIALRQAYADAGIEISMLRLVLCQQHVNDLLLEENSDFKKLYANFKDGVVNSNLGFEIRQFDNNPWYTVSTKAKLSFGATPDTDTDTQASVCFPLRKVGKASGITKMYWSKAENDPTYQRNLVNFRNYFLALPLVSKGFAAIISGFAAPVVDSPAIYASVETLSFLAAGEAKIVEISCKNNTAATVTGTGFSVSKSGETITVTAAANTGAERTGTLRVTDFVTGEYIEVELTQLAGN